MIISKKSSFLILSILFFGFLFTYYSELILHPNEYLFSSKSDGIKNYYTYAYQIKNNQSFSNFEGLNYPYGEHIFYTDCQPLLSVSLQKINKLFPFLSNYSVAIINVLMLLSIYVGAIFLFLLFIKLKLPPLLSIINALGIMILSPQIFRMNGHLALSYSCFIPITIYLLFQTYSSTKKIKWGILLLINNLIWLFTHAYLGIIAIFLIISFEFCILIHQIAKSSFYELKKRGMIILSTLIPVCLFLLIKVISDTHLNRDTTPYGFFEYYADFDTVLLPNHGKLKEIIFSYLPDFTQTWEGWAYIGLGSILSMILLFVLSVKQTIISKEIQLSHFNNSFLKKLLFASLIVLFFSFGLPFRWGLQSWLDYIPILEQFRSIGRFAWVFYFIINISAAYFIYQLSLKIRFKPYSSLLLLSLPVLMSLEGKSYHLEVSNEATRNPNIFNQQYLNLEMSDALMFIDNNNYQALIPLPYYSIGSENYEREGSEPIYKHSMAFSYHLNIPILAIHLARTSIKESRNSLQLLSPSIYPKYIQDDIPSKKPFLVIRSKENIRKDEMELLQKAKLINTYEHFELYELSYDSLFLDTRKDEINKFNSIKNSLILKEKSWTNDSSFFYHESKIRSLNKNNANKLYSVHSNKLELKSIYTSSIWLQNEGPNFGQDQLNYLEFEMREILENEIIQEKKIEVMSSSTIYNGWTRIEIEFEPKNSNSRIEFHLKGNDPKDKTIIVQDFFLSKNSQSTYWFNTDSTILFKNNHQIKY